ncbi:unnamed protein product [Ectocarpus sp. 12 AP-2014]
MFARSGGGGDDDPYNFNIADGFGGGGSKKKTKKSKLGKLSLNKTVGASPSVSSLTPQEVSRPVANPTPSVVDLKASLRASAPAGPTSALDKAMSFLNKYKQGGANGAKTMTAATGMGAFRKSANAQSTTFDQDEMELSLSSDSDGAGSASRQKTPSRLKPTRDKPSLEPQENMVKVRSLAGLSTTKELGANDVGNLGRPKAAISPVGLQRHSSASRSAADARLQADAYSPSEGRTSSLRLAVTIPGDSSPLSSLVRQGSDSDVESIRSAVAEELEDQTGEEEEVFTSPDSRSPTFEHQSGSSQKTEDNGRVESGSGFARSHPGRGALGSIMSFDDLAKVSGQRISPDLDDKGDNTSSDGVDREQSAGNGGSYTAEDEEEEDDDYGDDDFEDLDLLMDSNGGKSDGQRVLNASTLIEDPRTSPQQPISGHGTNSASPTGVMVTRENQCQVAGATAECRRCLATSETVGDPLNGVPEPPREAWSVPPANTDKSITLPAMVESGTSPDTDGIDDGVVSESSTRAQERAPSGATEAWGERLGSGPSAKVGDTMSLGTATTKDDGMPPCVSNATRCREDRAAARGTGQGGTSIGNVSKRGILIDRSTEMNDAIRPPGMEVKVVVRTEAVASVEYAHDPERGLDLRSYGTQIVGNSAAIQANIAVPGMSGTHSAVGNGFGGQGPRTPGVGYQPGEPYAKWGRFACEMPVGSRIGRDPDVGGEAPVWRSSPNSRRRPRSSGGSGFHGSLEGKNDCTGSGAGAANAEDDGGDSRAAQPSDSEVEPEEGYGRGPVRVSCAPSVRSGPAYLETFLEIMAKSEAESCRMRQHVLGENASNPRACPSSGERHKRCEEERYTADGAEGAGPGFRDRVRGQPQEQYERSNDVDIALADIMTATQDSFRKQLAEMRENLNNIRHRAEIAGRQGYVHHYESVTDVRDFVAKARPPATSLAEALRTVDPSLSLEKAEALVGGGTIPSSPVEQHS